MPRNGPSDFVYAKKQWWWSVAAPPPAYITPAQKLALASLNWVGQKIQFNAVTNVWGMRLYVGLADPNPYAAILFDGSGNLLNSRMPFQVASHPTADGWVQLWFPKKTPALANTDYYIAALFGGHFFHTANALSGGNVTHGRIVFVGNFQTTAIWPPTATLTLGVHANGIDVLELPGVR
jgi:hypothetical protein